MATVTLLGTTFDTNSGTHTVTATPSVGDLIVVVTANTGSTTQATVTDDNSSGTYVTDTGVIKNAGSDGMCFFVRSALISSAVSTIFTAAPGATSGGGLSVFAVSGMSKTGLNALRQDGTQSNIAGPSTPAQVMDGSVLTTNPVIAAVFNGVNPGGVTATASPAYTLQVNTGYATPTTGITIQSINSGETASTITWGSSTSTFCALAWELDATLSKMTGVNTITGINTITF